LKIAAKAEKTSMPRALNEAERTRALAQLKTSGRERFLRQGLANTSIAQLAQDAGIGKGTFYLFFRAKEELFLAIAQDEEVAFRSQLLGELSRANSGEEALRQVLRAPSHRLAAHPFLRMILEPETLAALRLRVEPQTLAENERGDREFFISLARDWKKRGWLRADFEPQQLFHALAGLYILAVQKGNLGLDLANDVERTLIEACCTAWSSIANSP
jgi:AcrR family transcriptional regulator